MSYIQQSGNGRGVLHFVPVLTAIGCIFNMAQIKPPRRSEILLIAYGTAIGSSFTKTESSELPTVKSEQTISLNDQ